MELYIDGEKYDPGSYIHWTATTDQIEWLKENAIPLSSDSPGSDFSDLDQLNPLFENVKIVGLGEATHGTYERVFPNETSNH